MLFSRMIVTALMLLLLARFAAGQTRPATQPTIAQLQATIAAQKQQITDLQVQIDHLRAQLATAAQTRPSRTPPQTRAATAPADAGDKILQENLVEITAESQGLEKILSFLSENFALNLVVDWNDLAAAGVDRNTPISVRLRNVTLEKALLTVLAQASRTAPLDFIVDGNTLTIARRETLATQTTVLIYDVRKLVNNDAAADTLIKTIEKSVMPESWHDNGGTIGSIRYLNGNLIITHNYRGHKAIALLLQQLGKTAP